MEGGEGRTRGRGDRGREGKGRMGKGGKGVSWLLGHRRPWPIHSRLICDIYDLFAPHINVLTYSPGLDSGCFTVCWLNAVRVAVVSTGQRWC